MREILLHAQHWATLDEFRLLCQESDEPMAQLDLRLLSSDPDLHEAALWPPGYRPRLRAHLRHRALGATSFLPTKFPGQLRLPALDGRLPAFVLGPIDGLEAIESIRSLLLFPDRFHYEHALHLFTPQEHHQIAFLSEPSTLPSEPWQLIPLIEGYDQLRQCEDFYLLGKRLARLQQAARLPNHYLRLESIWHAQDWRDPIKGLVSVESPDYLRQSLEGYPEPPRRPPKGRRLAHVAPQMVDQGHAPSRLLRTLLNHAQKFEPHLILTEAHQVRPNEYPPHPYFSPSSTLRGSQSLDHLHWIETEFTTYEATARRVADQLKEFDIAIFHGPDPINLIAARLSDVPLKVFFDHSYIPHYPHFDLVISSKADEGGIPYVIEPEFEGPPPNLGVRAATTISLQLENRLSPEFCEAVTRILKACPDLYYLPIGPASESLKARFPGVEERVQFLGPHPNPADLARGCELYFNEFPFGSGLAVLDALHAGLPVVTLNDPEGPAQARYGAQYAGRSVTTPDEYVDLAIRLYRGQEEWTAPPLRTAEEYVGEVEGRLLGALPARKALLSWP